MGIDHGKMQEIVDEANCRKMAIIRWFIIWSVIFPDEEPPLQPHLSGRLESMTYAIRDFWMKHGLQITSDFLTENDHADISVNKDNEIMLYHSVLDRMINLLVVNSEESEGGLAQGCSRAAQILALSPS
ncbi:hypothetical protein F4810DRAFT_659209 [Camillea tinctor]|nr:hypothetical protein F4810DRAFT_659209 [Camillea tinctor]